MKFELNFFLNFILCWVGKNSVNNHTSHPLSDKTFMRDFVKAERPLCSIDSSSCAVMTIFFPESDEISHLGSFEAGDIKKLEVKTKN